MLPRLASPWQERRENIRSVLLCSFGRVPEICALLRLLLVTFKAPRKQVLFVNLSVSVALFPFDLSFSNWWVRQLQVQCNIHERLIYARLCSRITGHCMLYAALIAFYDQRTRPEFLKYGIYESLIHAGFKGPLSVCPAQMGRSGEMGGALCAVNKTASKTPRAVSWTLQSPGTSLSYRKTNSVKYLSLKPSRKAFSVQFSATG